MNPQKDLLVLAVAILTITVTLGRQSTHKRPMCGCVCAFHDRTVCETVQELKSIADANAEQLRIWATYRQFIQQFSERWQEEISDIVETTIKDYVSKGKLYPKPENLVEKLDDGMLNDSAMIIKPVEDDKNLVKNVTTLLEKVEMVENRTIEVEKELKTERRVRRDLEEKVNLAHVSLVHIEDQLLNVSAPVDAMVTQVEMKLYASIEDLNKTIYEDHLQKLYYKVDGVAYKNEIKKLDERLETVEVELHDGGNSSIMSKLADGIKYLEENLYLLNNSIGDIVIPRLETLNNSIDNVLMPRIHTLEEVTVRKDAAEELEYKMLSLLNDTDMFRIALEDVLLNVQDVKNLEKKFQDFSEQLTKSLEAMQNQIEFLKTETFGKDVEDTDDTAEIVQISSLDVTDDLTQAEDKTTNIIEFSTKSVPTTEEPTTPDFDISRSRMDEDPDNNFISCHVPDNDDSHLLIDIVKSEEGMQSLKFGCKPIGHYVVPFLPVPPRCMKGSWKNPFPRCVKLLNMTDIETLAEELLKEHPCRGVSGEFPDPNNCTQFFKCAHGRATVIPCKDGLHFNPTLRVCDYPRVTSCFSDKSQTVEKLQTLIPPIYTEPQNLDKPGSLLATGKTGELIVHPRSSFTLHCLYPENIYGNPKWNVTYLKYGINPKVLTFKEGINRVSLTITAAKEEDSGTYRCVTPFGVQHDIEVVVKAVVCPAFPKEDDYEDVFYRPTPEGELRILGTTAEVQCEEGHKVIAQCMSNGTWSRVFPSKEECTPKRRKDDKMWNCKPLDISKHPDLILERYDDERIVSFKCAGGMRLVGNTFTRCLVEGIWTHTTLPSCKK